MTRLDITGTADAATLTDRRWPRTLQLWLWPGWIIVLALCGYDIDRARRDYEILRGFSDFDSLPAARRGEIHLVDASAYFARPGPRVVDSLEILAGILHPQEFPEFAPRAPEDSRVARLNRQPAQTQPTSSASGRP